MTTILRSSWHWLLVNTAGLSTFIYFSSWIWAPRGQEGLLGGPGEAFVWMTSAFLVLAVCAVLDLLWFIFILARPHCSTRWPLLALWFLVVACWIAVQAYNRSRSYTGADVIQDFSHP